MQSGILAAAVLHNVASLASSCVPPAHNHQAAGDEGLPLLAEELLRSLEDPTRAPGASALVAGFCRGVGGDRREALQEHVDALMTVCFVCCG